MGGLEILPIEIFLLREKSFHLSISTTVPYLDAFFYSGVGFFFSLSFRRCHHPGAIKKKETRTVVCGINNKKTSRFALLFIYLFIYLFIHFLSSLCSISPGWNQASGGLHTRAMCVVKTDAQLVRQSIHLGE